MIIVSGIQSLLVSASPSGFLLYYRYLVWRRYYLNSVSEHGYMILHLLARKRFFRCAALVVQMCPAWSGPIAASHVAYRVGQGDARDHGHDGTPPARRPLGRCDSDYCASRLPRIKTLLDVIFYCSGYERLRTDTTRTSQTVITGSL